MASKVHKGYISLNNNLVHPTNHIWGHTEANANVEIKYGKTVLAKAHANQNGSFSFRLKNKLSAGSRFKVISVKKGYKTAYTILKTYKVDIPAATPTTPTTPQPTNTPTPTLIQNNQAQIAALQSQLTADQTQLTSLNMQYANNDNLSKSMKQTAEDIGDASDSQETLTGKLTWLQGRVAVYQKEVDTDSATLVKNPNDGNALHKLNEDQSDLQGCQDAVTEIQNDIVTVQASGMDEQTYWHTYLSLDDKQESINIQRDILNAQIANLATQIAALQ